MHEPPLSLPLLAVPILLAGCGVSPDAADVDHVSTRLIALDSDHLGIGSSKDVCVYDPATMSLVTLSFWNSSPDDYAPCLN